MRNLVSVRPEYGEYPVHPALVAVDAVGLLRDELGYIGRDRSAIIEAFAVKDPAESNPLISALRGQSGSLAAQIVSRYEQSRTIRAYAIRFGAEVQGIGVYSRGLALAAGNSNKDVHVLSTLRDVDGELWLDTGPSQEREELLLVLHALEDDAELITDNRTFYWGNLRRFNRDSYEAGLFDPSGIILNNPGIARRIL
jgi:hypothetical protein